MPGNERKERGRVVNEGSGNSSSNCVLFPAREVFAYYQARHVDILLVNTQLGQRDRNEISLENVWLSVQIFPWGQLHVDAEHFIFDEM